MKKITLLAMIAFAAAFTAYKAFDDLAESFQNWDVDFEDGEDLEGF